MHLMDRYKAILTANFLIFLLTICTANADNSNDSPVILQLSWFHQFEFAGYYAALEKGYYQKEGIKNVIINPGGPALDEAQLVAAGQAQYGVLSSELLVKWINGLPIIVLAVIMQHSKRALIVRSDSPILAPSDLIGRTIMLNLNEHEEFLAMFIREGVVPKKITIIHKDKTASSKLIDDTIVAMNGSIGNQPYSLKMKGVSTRNILPINYGIDFYGDSLFTSESEMKENPERVAGFRRATVRGWEYAMKHPEEIINLILEKYNKKKTSDQLRFEAEQHQIHY
ncbi:MAG: ABC transporter substrate-binding protein [Deltaproteobacteria bacterium]|nr:ABC transporter substrate-binding protein [Deltaproteobacteria bacterium]